MLESLIQKEDLNIYFFTNQPSMYIPGVDKFVVVMEHCLAFVQSQKSFLKGFKSICDTTVVG
jgi:hypothetical protein